MDRSSWLTALVGEIRRGLFLCYSKTAWYFYNGSFPACMGGAQKELKEIQKSAEEQGWRVKELKSGHRMFLAPDGINKVTSPGTPGGGRGMDNFIAQLRSYGLVWKGR